MKVLFISPFYPFPPRNGAERRITALSEGLAKKCEVVLAAPTETGRSDPPPSIKLYLHGRRQRWIQLFDPRFFLRIGKILMMEKPDFIILEFPWHGLQVIPQAKLFKIPLVYDAHNLEWRRLKETGSVWWLIILLIEKLLILASARTLVVSSADLTKFLKFGADPNKIKIIPNGVDFNVFPPNPNKGEQIRSFYGWGKNLPVFLFFGAFGYQPNVEAVKITDLEIAPRILKKVPQAKFVIAGERASSLRRYSHIENLGLVNDITSLINASNVVIVPVQKGGGTRLKILESIACGIPVVTTPKGAEGLNMKAIPKDRLLVYDDWDKFAEGGVRCLKLPSFRKIPKVFRETYSWEISVNQLLRLLNDLVRH